MKVSKDLQDQVRANPSILNVFFSKLGEHFFHTHEIKVHRIIDNKSASKEFEWKTVLPVTKYQPRVIRIDSENARATRVPIEYEEAKIKMTREEILKATVEPAAGTLIAESISDSESVKKMKALEKELKAAKEEAEMNAALAKETEEKLAALEAEKAKK